MRVGVELKKIAVYLPENADVVIFNKLITILGEKVIFEIAVLDLNCVKIHLGLDLSCF